MSDTTFTPGDEVVAEIALFEGGHEAVAAVVTRVEPCSIFVRLVGFLPAPYRAGDVLPLDVERVRPVAAPVVVRHRDGLVWFAA